MIVGILTPTQIIFPIKRWVTSPACFGGAANEATVPGLQSKVGLFSKTHRKAPFHSFLLHLSSPLPQYHPLFFLPDALPDACLPLLGPGEEEEEGMEGKEVDQTKQAEEGKKKSGLGKIERGRKDVVEEGKVRGRKGSWHSHIQPPSRAQEVAIGGEWHTFVFFLVSVLISVTVFRIHLLMP